MPLEREPRVVCPACRRPASVCYCRHVTKVPTRTRVVVLQHPRERDMPIGTARMATLCLPNAELHEGVVWDDAKLERLLSDPSDPDRRPVLLYPGEGAIDVMTDPPRGPVTLVVVDGTWWQARKVVRANPRLLALPRYAFTPPNPSEYRIRKEPAETYVSTIEALVHVLGALEEPGNHGGGALSLLLDPFRAMIDTQIAHVKAQNGAGARHARHAEKRAKTKKPRIHPLFATSTNAERIVCVAGEANAWPYRARAREDAQEYVDELVHWVARRVVSGETFESVVAPVRPLAPRTSRHVELDEARLRAGGTHRELFDRWRAFVRDGDVICFWGHYAAGLFVASGGHLPKDRLDLRAVCRDHEKARVGTLEEHVAHAGLAVMEPRMAGRAGRRLAELEAVVLRFVEMART
jgi:DTW domain-containing protein